MKTQLIIFSILVLIISPTLVSAEENYVIEFNQFGEKIIVEHIISFEQEQKAEITIPEDARAISSNVNYTLKDNILEIEGKNIEISYITSENLDKIRNKYYFVSKLEFNFDVENVEIKLILDEGFVFEEGKSYPEPLATETDGRNIWIVWNFKDIKKGQDMPIFVSFRDTKVEINRMLIFVLIIGVIIVFYLYFLKKGKKSVVKKVGKRKIKKEEVIEEYLLDSEKAVVSELKNSEKKELWQKQLQIKTEFSKAKLSRIIRNLEARNLIKKIPFGNTNKIKLK